MFRVFIAGSRSFTDFDLLCAKCDFYLQNKKTSDISIISGGAKGADALARKYAEIRGFKFIEYLADWSIGKKAGILRNIEMADNADAVICFYDGKSKGTSNMIYNAKKRNLLLRVVYF